MFHVAHDTGAGRATRAGSTGNMTVKQELSDFEAGFLVGVLVGEGHFGGDGRQPQVTLRMHTDHVALFAWLTERCGGRLYGPYHHGGRSYYQWMARGAYLRQQLVPLLDRFLTADLDGKVHGRYLAMKRAYGIANPAAESARPP